MATAPQLHREVRVEASLVRIDTEYDGMSAELAEIRAQRRDFRFLIIGSILVILFGVLGVTAVLGRLSQISPL